MPNSTKLPGSRSRSSRSARQLGGGALLGDQLGATHGEGLVLAAPQVGEEGLQSWRLGWSVIVT